MPNIQILNPIPYKGVVYKITNLVNGKVYIGKTVSTLQRRLWNHIYSSRSKQEGIFHKAIAKYGTENFQAEVLLVSQCNEQLCLAEKHYIQEFKCKVPNGYNLTDGGDGSTGFIKSAETRLKIGASSRLHKHSEEARKLMSIRQKGKVLSYEHKLKISSAHKGSKRVGDELQILRQGNLKRLGLSQEQILSIYNDPRKSSIIAKEYDKPYSTINNIRRGTTFAWVTQEA